MSYKCHTCYSIWDDSQIIDGCCPCGEKHIEKMCKLDHICTCEREHSEGIIICPSCHEPTCPCGCHDVVVISRVTGYLSDISGWNEGKRAELIDRNRVNLT